MDHLLIVEVGDLIEDMIDVIIDHDELPVFASGGNNDNNLSAFLRDIYQAMAYRPGGTRDIGPNVRDVLDDCDVYFAAPNFSTLQQDLWYKFADQLLERFDQFKLYDSDHIHRYDYHELQGPALLLKLAE